MRVRAGVVIRNGDAVLLIHRFKRGREYYLIPGGGLEPGESIREAARREIREETGLTVEIGAEIFVHYAEDQVEHYFRAISYSGEPRLGGEELAKSSEENVYLLEWIESEKLNELPFESTKLRDLLVEHLRETM